MLTFLCVPLLVLGAIALFTIVIQRFMLKTMGWEPSSLALHLLSWVSPIALWLLAAMHAVNALSLVEERPAESERCFQHELTVVGLMLLIVVFYAGQLNQSRTEVLRRASEHTMNQYMSRFRNRGSSNP